MNVRITRVRHRWSERAGFVLQRPTGIQEYILLHFLSDVELNFAGETHHAGKGAFIVFSPGTPHGFVSRDVLLHDWMHITGDMAQLMERYGLATDTLYQTDASAGISEIVAFAENEFFSHRPYWEELISVKVQEMLIRVSHCVISPQLPSYVREETAERLREVRERILSSPWEAWSVRDLARSVNVSESRLHAVYKAVFGISPRKDLILIRTEKAKSLLMSGVTVAAAAEQLGYASTTHFIRQFRMTVGITPKQYVLNSKKG